MEKAVRHSILYFSFWMVYFGIDRAFSLVYHFNKTLAVSASDLIGTFTHGARMDASASAYLSVIPFLCLIFNQFRKITFVHVILSAYTYFIVALCTVLCLIDRGIFDHWGYRLDATPLQFIATPNEMLASLSLTEKFIAFGFGTVWIGFWCYLVKRFVLNPIRQSTSNSWSGAMLQFLFTVLLFFPIRGGLQLIPMNTSLVYFSNSQYANQTAVNPIWNFGYSVSKKASYEKENPYAFFDKQTANTLVKALLPNTDADSADVNILNTAITKPNVIVIIWESLTAKNFAPLGGRTGILPELEQIAKEGLLFTNIYANGNRSDKGLIAIGSAYPAQTTQSIAFLTNKVLKLPHISHEFNAKGYQSSFYYGGDLNFGNMWAYYNQGAYQPIIGKKDFEQKDMNKKWGASDAAVFNKLLADTPDDNAPFFKMLFTLSSHEPFDVPNFQRIQGADEDAKFWNAHAYTDSCLGTFIRTAKTRRWWDNTLIVIVADHGTTMPRIDKLDYDAAANYHIPLIFTGGALRQKGQQNSTYGVQNDVVATILHQLSWSSKRFPYSRDLFSKQQPHFAHYVFNDGFGYLDASGCQLLYKNENQSFVINQKADSIQRARGLAYLQYTFQDFIDK